MPRKTRMYIAGVPAHVVQRGNNRNDTFFCPDDFLRYRHCLGEGLQRYGVALHAYVLMTNHVHLLMTPGDLTGISSVMQHVGRHYVLYVNRKYQRTGTLWEGRHKASLIHANDYLLTCMRYIEMNPVVACMVENPVQYRWSSHRFHVSGGKDELLTEHDVYRRLGADRSERQIRYLEFINSPSRPDEIEQIRQCLTYNHPLGNARFCAEIESALGLKIGYCKRGRPEKKGSE